MSSTEQSDHLNEQQGSLERVSTTLEFNPDTGGYTRTVVPIAEGNEEEKEKGKRKTSSVTSEQQAYASNETSAPISKMEARLPRRLTSHASAHASVVADNSSLPGGVNDSALNVSQIYGSEQPSALERIETTLEFDPETGDYRRVTAPSTAGESMAGEISEVEYNIELGTVQTGARSMRGSSLDRESLDLEANLAGQRNLSRKNSSMSNAKEGDHPMAVGGLNGGGAADESRRTSTNPDVFEYIASDNNNNNASNPGEGNNNVDDREKRGESKAAVNPLNANESETFLDQASRRLFGISNNATTMEVQIEHKIGPIARKVRYFFRNIMFESIWLILILLGSIMSVFAWCIDEITELLVDIRGDIGKLKHHNAERHPSLFTTWALNLDGASGFFLWWLWALVTGFGAVMVVRYIGPQAAGSGIEQVRSIQTGYPIPGYLEINTLIAKVVGLILTQASGLTIGKEGPFVHISCSLANLLLSMPLFADIKASKQLTKTVISAACATGVSSTFGAPVGGVLFAIEVTSSVFHTSDYWKSFFCAVAGEMVFRELSYFGTARSSQISLFPTTFKSQPYLLSELPLFLVLSGVCGLYGGLYVKFIIGIRSWRQSQLNVAEQWHTKVSPVGALENELNLTLEGRYGNNPATTLDGEEGESKKGFRNDPRVIKFVFYVHHYTMVLARYTLRPNGWAFTVISITAIMNWITGEYMMRSLYAGINDLLVSGQMFGDSNGPMDPRVRSPDWGYPSIIVTLLWYFVSKSFLCVIALSLAVPTGTLIPMLAIGLAMGRIVGELVQNIGGVNFAPGGYALVAAAAFIAGSTGAISTAVIIFEITAQLSYMVPVLLAVILGRSAGKVISPDLYEALQIAKKLPNIPPLTHQSSYKLTCAEVMNSNNIPMISRTTTPANISLALNKPTFRYHNEVADDDLFAVIDPSDNLYLGSVARHQLKALLTSFSGAERMNESLDVLGVCNANAVAPSIPLTTSFSDALFFFEITLNSTLFITDHSRVIGWLDLNTVRHKCESGEL